MSKMSTMKEIEYQMEQMFQDLTEGIEEVEKKTYLRMGIKSHMKRLFWLRKIKIPERMVEHFLNEKIPLPIPLSAMKKEV